MTGMHTSNVSYGPRLVANPTGALRAAMLVAVSAAIEEARPLAGEPSAVHARAASAQRILVKTLEYFGCDTTVLQPHGGDPYACAVADAAIAFENGVVMMRPCSMARRPQVAWLEAQLEQHDIPIAAHVSPPGLLDGSDVIMAGNTAFIGASARSNALGRNGFAQIARAHGYGIVEVRLGERAGSLRAVAGVLAKDAFVLAGPQYVDHAAFASYKVYTANSGDELGAGVLNLGEHHVLADMRFPKVVDMLRKRGVIVEAIDLYDFARVGITPSMLVADIKRV